MKKYLIIISLFLAPTLRAQEVISLQECLDAAISNAPRLKDRMAIDEEGKLIQEDIKTAWYPSMALNGKFSHQSDVITLDFEIPGVNLDIPEMPREQFGINLDINQTIYDGGLSKAKKNFEAVKTNASLADVEVDLYKLKEQLADLYLKILVIDENRNSLELALENLKEREKIMESALENGVAQKSDLQLLQVEVLKVLQGLSELDASREGLLAMLEEYMGQEFTSEISLEIPLLEWNLDKHMNRPEFELFELQSSVLEAGKNLSDVKRKPMVYAFGQAGYGLPGYNMLNDQLDTYYMLGAGLHWQIWDWKSNQRKKQQIDLQKSMLDHARESLSMQLEAGMSREEQQMEHLQNTIKLDEEMLKMRMEITESASSRLDNGTISSLDYIQVLNEEKSARIRQSMHKLQLLSSYISFMLLNGSL